MNFFAEGADFQKTRGYMRILHTSDWHIGKRLADRERLPEQIAVLDEIVRLCEREQVELVLVAGDVFDTYVPSAEAEEAFFRTVKRLAEGRAVVLVSGNHDDGVRLASSAPLAGEEGIYIFGNKPSVMPTGGSSPVRAVESGENWLVIENAAGERVYVNALPYPNEARLKEEKTEETYAEKTARWISKGAAGYRGDMPYILLAHIFVAGGRVSESERDIDLGGARAVPPSSLPQEGYVALGHLHRRQRAGERGRYSGSILQYSFDEANTEKSVVLLETKGTEIAVAKEIPLTAGKRLVRLECNGAGEALSLLPQYENCLIELTLRLSAPLTAQETQSLRESNEGLVTLRTLVGGESAAYPVRSALSAKELFSVYYRTQYGEQPPEELLSLFLTLLGEGEA